MSPRAAWRLEAAGFGPVHDYVAGKSDWLAADLDHDGSAQLVGAFTRREVAVVRVGQPVAAAIAAYDGAGFGPVVVVNDAHVVRGVARQDRLRRSPGDTPVEQVTSFGVSTVRPSESAGDLVMRMRELETTRVVVTDSEGRLIGLFFADDVTTG